MHGIYKANQIVWNQFLQLSEDSLKKRSRNISIPRQYAALQGNFIYI